MPFHETAAYDLRVVKGKPTLRFRDIETHKILNHDAAIALPGIPDIFVPISAPGMAAGVFEAHCPPMRAMGAMVDAKFFAFEDIDRLDTLREGAKKEAFQKAFNDLMAEFIKKAAESLTESGCFKGPTPVGAVESFTAKQEALRRTKLMVEKFEAENGIEA